MNSVQPLDARWIMVEIHMLDHVGSVFVLVKIWIYPLVN